MRKLVVVCLLLFVCGSLLAQKTINGRVTATGGAPIPSATISFNNRGGGITSADGTYTITVAATPGKYSLVITAVGYKAFNQTITIGNAASYKADAVLSTDVLNLEEVVVTGATAGTTRKQLGSYVSTVQADKLLQAGATNVLTALQGKTAGAQIIQNSGDPAGGVSVRLRGISSVNSSSDPLYIVDGVIVNNATNRVTNTSGNYDGNNFVGTIGQNRMADINPDDIERIEVLNGAAAAAIYGSRANAGVVQIFTKRGSSGAPQVSVHTSLIVNSLRKRIEVNQSPIKFGGSPDVQTQDILTPTLTNTTPVTRYDYQDAIFRTGIGTDNTVSVSGGQNQTKYYASGSYFKNQGIIKNTDFQRYSFRLNLDQAFGSKLNLTAGVNYINSLSNEKPDGQSFFSPMNSVTILGNFHDIYTKDANGNLKAVGERGRVNPLSVIDDIKQQQETNRVLANASLKYRPIKGLLLDYTIGFDNYSQRGTTFIPPFAYNASTAFYGGGPSLDATLNGYASAGSNQFFQVNHEANATYNASLGKSWNSITQVGYSVQYEKNNYQLIQGRGLAPFVSTVTSAATLLPSADDRSQLSISGAYVQQNFKYKTQFFITGALRVDGSSVFGEDQRNLKYLKASGSYVPSEADFWKNSSIANWWNTLKLRAAYGQSGNLTGIGAYARFNTYTPSTFTGRIALNSSNSLSNEGIKPEKQGELEIGTDMAFLNSRVTLQFNWYNKKVTDLLFNRFVAPTTGYSSVLGNIGSLSNKGIEIVLTGTPVQTKSFRWDITGIFNRNKNKAINIGQSLLLLSTNAGAPVAIIEGQPIGVFYGTFFARDANGNELKNTTGIPQTERGTQLTPTTYTTSRDATTGLPSGTTLRKVLGNPNPDYTTSLTNEFAYKRLALKVQLDAVKGVDVWNADWRTRQGVGNGKVAEMEDNGQIPRGYIAGVYAIEEWRIDDGSFVKLREISLSYDLGKIKGFRSISVNLSGRNLISWDHYKGYDPEVNAAGQSTVLRGIDFGSVPIPRTFNVGVNARF